MTPEPAPQYGRRLVGDKALLEILFPNEEDRPTTRWLDKMKKARAIPYKKLGRLVWYDPAEVRDAFDRKFTIQARN